MGGYGLYVWGSFGLTALLMLVEVVSLRARRRSLRHTDASEFAGAPHEA